MERRLAAIMLIDMVGYSRLVRQNEEATVARQSLHRSRVLDPKIENYDGRIVKSTGDGVLVEFTSVVKAITCAIEIQEAVARLEVGAAEDQRIRYRIGVNLGDVIVSGDDILGDGVNIAARLEGLSPPGGIAISANVYEYVYGKVGASFVDGGKHAVKNIERPLHVWIWERGDFDKARNDRPSANVAQRAGGTELHQKIQYCMSSDGTALAYASVGQGLPLVKAQHFMSHLEHDWNSPTFGPFYRELAARYHFVRADQRGNGLSERNPKNFTFEHLVDDLEAVVDSAGLDRFALYALSQGSAVAVAYAVRHPKKVSALILHGGYVRGRLKRGKMSDDDIAKVHAMTTLIRTGWGQDNPAFRRMFSNQFIPGGESWHMDSFDEMMRVATEPDMAARIFETNCYFDTTQIVGRVQAPTLVLHSRTDMVSPFEEGRRLAAGIPNAELVELDSPNHILLHDEPATKRLLIEIDRFLKENQT